MSKFLDDNGLLYLWGKIKALIPKKTSELTNDSGYITAQDVPDAVSPSTTQPKMDGTAALGTDGAFARGDHVHPHDTTKVDKVEGKGLSSEDFTTEEKAKLAGIAEGANNYVPKAASTTQKGEVQLSSAVDSTSEALAATPKAVKAAYDMAQGKQSPATTLAGYGIKDAYTKDEVDGMVSSALHYMGTKATYGALPTTGNKVGDVWNITAADSAHGIKAGDNVAWNGTSWDVLAGTVDLSAYMLKTDMVPITNAEIDTICA